ncbi:MAG: acyl carrier protein [Bacteroidales bacterium]|nr:acyl carrier protein [Clostridium sp.]MCM1203859.1 acyl carrier protein [Bacteroidales bacterium]
MEEIVKILEEMRPEFDFRGSDNFIEDGYLDSFDLVTLISEIEEKYGISIDGLDIIPENFETVEAIVKLINKSGGNIR